MHTESIPSPSRKSGSFLSRILHSRKKHDTAHVDAHSEDEASDNGLPASSHGQPNDTRATGTDAEIFAQPINGYAYIPQYPQPPKYIKVRSHNRKRKDFDRVFVAQELLDAAPKDKGTGTGGSGTTSRPVTAASGVKPNAPSDAPKPQQQQQGTSHGQAIWTIEFSRSGRFLAAAGQDHSVKVWSVISSPSDRQAHEIEEEARDDQIPIRLTAPVFKAQPVQIYEGHTGSVVDLSWSKNDFLLSTSMDKTVRLWHVTRGECLCVFKHSDFVTSIKFHPKDDRFFLAGSLDSKLRLWSIPDKSVAYEAVAPDMITAVAFTPDGKHAIAGLLNGMCIIYDTDGLKVLSQIHVGGGDHKASLHPGHSSHRRRRHPGKGSKITGIDSIFLPPENPCSATGQLKLLITSNDSRIRLYNFKDRALEAKLRGNENSASQIRASFSSDGRYIICGSESRRAYIWPTEAMGPLYDHILSHGHAGSYNGSHREKDLEFRSFEVFEAQSAAVTNAVMAPVRTKQILGASGDLLYDLCNPPPVTLGANGVAGDKKSSPKSETFARPKKPYASKSFVTQPPRTPTSPTLAEFSGKPGHGDDELPGYMAPASHPDSNILVTSDTNGSIKVFRQDCGYWKRPSFHPAAAAFVGSAATNAGDTVPGVSGPVNMTRAVQNATHHSHLGRLSLLRHNSASTRKSVGSASNISAIPHSRPPSRNQKQESASRPTSASTPGISSQPTVPVRGPVDRLKDEEIPARSGTVKSATPSERILSWRDNIATQKSNSSAESVSGTGDQSNDLRNTLSASGWTAGERTRSPSPVPSGGSRLSISNLWNRHRAHRQQASSDGRFALRDRSKKVYKHHPYYNSRETSTSQVDVGESRPGSRAPTIEPSESDIVVDSRRPSIGSAHEHDVKEQTRDGSVSNRSSMDVGKEVYLSLPGSPVQGALRPDMSSRSGFVTSAGFTPLSPPSTTGDRDTVRDSTSVNREAWNNENENIDTAAADSAKEDNSSEKQTQSQGRLGSGLGLAAGALYWTKLAAQALTSRRSRTNLDLPKLTVSGTNGTNTPISSVEHTPAPSIHHADESSAQLRDSQSHSSLDKTTPNTATSSRLTMDLNTPVSPAPPKVRTRHQYPSKPRDGELDGQDDIRRGLHVKSDKRFSFAWNDSKSDIYDEDEDEDDEQELRCERCGHNDFRAMKKMRRLICTRCGTAMHEEGLDTPSA